PEAEAVVRAGRGEAVEDLLAQLGRHAGPRVEFWVSDTGPGVPPELREEIFDRFTTTSTHDGFGLGLSIVSAIAEAHGGRVTLDDSPAGSGAVFRVRLPREEDR
ncbi:HAMP domain-containing histidine kinase, partial [bacterium]